MITARVRVASPAVGAGELAAVDRVLVSGSGDGEIVTGAEGLQTLCVAEAFVWSNGTVEVLS